MTLADGYTGRFRSPQASRTGPRKTHLSIETSTALYALIAKGRPYDTVLEYPRPRAVCIERWEAHPFTALFRCRQSSDQDGWKCRRTRSTKYSPPLTYERNTRTGHPKMVDGGVDDGCWCCNVHTCASVSTFARARYIRALPTNKFCQRTSFDEAT